MPLIPAGWLILVVVAAIVAVVVMHVRIDYWKFRLKSEKEYGERERNRDTERLDNSIKYRKDLERKIDSITAECRFWKQAATDYGFPVLKDLPPSDE